MRPFPNGRDSLTRFRPFKNSLPHDPTDRPYDACLRPILPAPDRSGPGPAEDRPAIFGRALLTTLWPYVSASSAAKTSTGYGKATTASAWDLALRIRNICPSLSLSWLLGGEGDPEAPDRTSAEAASAEVLYLPLYPDLLSLDRDFRPGEDRRIPFPSWLCHEAEAAVSCCSDALSPRLLPGDCMLLARTPAESIVFGRAYVVVVERPGCAGLSAKGESPERVRLVSLKPGKYDEIAVPRTEIDGLYRICGTFRYWAD